jgi:acyl-coenzyme A synthetase/AMP-(fatty) acid ligase
MAGNREWFETVAEAQRRARKGRRSVVFGGFSSIPPRSRIEDTESKLVITSDEQYRREARAAGVKDGKNRGLRHDSHG